MARASSGSTGRIAIAGVLAVFLAACGGGGGGGGTASCTTDAGCDDGNPCTADTCDGAGACAHAPAAADTLCSTGGGHVCDGAGACVACNDAGPCEGTSPADDCQHPACVNHACVPAFTAAGTATTGSPAQAAGDCKRRECDGAGGVVEVADGADLPVDGKECTADVCTAGVPSNPPVAAGTACGPGLALRCNATGECGCRGNADCTLPETCGGGGTPLVCGCTPTTCAALGATCGQRDDGCGGALNCDDTTKNGAETDVDCGGAASSCGTRCASGKTCLAGSDCASGNCVDGYCCNSPCGGTCMACSAALTGGPNGSCRAIAAGTDPKNHCSDQGAASCGTDGVCDGAGACQRYPAGTVCASPTCSGGTQTTARACDGAGTCLTGTTRGCAPYVCGGSACLTTCTSNLHCATGHTCNVGSMTCL